MIEDIVILEWSPDNKTVRLLCEPGVYVGEEKVQHFTNYVDAEAFACRWVDAGFTFRMIDLND